MKDLTDDAYAMLFFVVYFCCCFFCFFFSDFFIKAYMYVVGTHLNCIDK